MDDGSTSAAVAAGGRGGDVVTGGPRTVPARGGTDEPRDVADPRATFTWEQARSWLDGLPGGQGRNIAYEAVSRHARGERADHVAIRWLGKDDASVELTYRQLDEASDRFANVLADLGIAPGERVFLLLGRVPELYVAALGTLKHRAVLCPLFSAFGPEPSTSAWRWAAGACW
jgi:acetyl-CoA synthetase